MSLMRGAQVIFEDSSDDFYQGIVRARYSDLRPDDKSICRHHPGEESYLVENQTTGNLGLYCESQLREH